MSKHEFAMEFVTTGEVTDRDGNPVERPTETQEKP
jgi:hypothetical protein